MKTWTSNRAKLAALAAAALMTGLGLWLAVASSADTQVLTLTATNAGVGQAIHAEAQLAEAPDASGEISFEVFGPDDPSCSGPALSPAPASASVSGEGGYTSGDFTTAEAGTYHWSAHYSGDGTNPPADSECSAASVASKTTPSLSGNASDATVNTAIHDEVTVSGGFSPSGEVVFKVFAPGDNTCATPLTTSADTISGGHASSQSYLPQQAGEFRWTAEYTGDDNNKSVLLGCGASGQASTVGKASPGLAGTASSAQVGSTIKDSVTVSGGFSPNGELHFRAYGPGDSSCAGAVQYEATVSVNGNGPYAPAGFSPGAGSYNWKVEYTGDADNNATSLACGAPNQTSTVGKASPGLAGTASSAQVGSTIKDSVTVSGGFSPNGELHFRAYGPGDSSCAGAVKYEATVSVNGNGLYAPAGFSPGAGSYNWKVEYTGDADNNATSLACGAPNQTSTVGKASPGLSGTATSGSVGSAITDNVTLSNGFSPGGQLRFRVYGPGDSSCSGSVQYEATVAVSGNGGYAPSGFAPGAGSYRWTVEYEGDSNNNTASLACGASNQSSIVGKASPSLTGSASSGAAGATITDTVTLADGSPSAGGELHFRAYGAGDSACGGGAQYEASVTVSGNGPYSPPGFTTGVGSYRWEVEYSGDANNEPAELTCGAPNQTSTVGKATPGLTGTASSGPIGSTITDSVTLSGGFEHDGEIHFRAFSSGDTSCSGPAQYETVLTVDHGNTTYAPAGFAPGAGTYRWTVEYTGDADNNPASLPCGSTNQESTVSKAAPTLTGTATSAQVGATITDNVTLASGVNAGGNLRFRAFGPGDSSCAAAPSYEATVAVNGNGAYAPPGFKPAPGLYHWSVEYSGDGNNEGAGIGCGDPSQASAVGVIDISLTASATSATVGNPVAATATIREGAIPGGQITFAAFAPTDTSCTGTPSFTKTLDVVGNATYHSEPVVPTRTGAFRWVVSYSGDANHAATKTPCGTPTSTIASATPSIASTVPQELSVGTPFQITATLQSGFAPTGTVSFRIYGPNATTCDKPLSTNTVTVSANGTVSSAPFVALNPGRYLFVASYSGNSNNQAAAESCDPNGRVAVVGKRVPKVKPNARLKGKRISIRARLIGATSPIGTVRFRLYRPGNKTCAGKPAFSGGVTVKANGRYLLAQYLARKPGIYRIAVSYSGDKRNKHYDSGCTGAQQVHVG